MRLRFLLLLFMFSALVIITSERVQVEPDSRASFSSVLLAGDASARISRGL